MQSRRGWACSRRLYRPTFDIRALENSRREPAPRCFPPGATTPALARQKRLRLPADLSGYIPWHAARSIPLEVSWEWRRGSATLRADARRLANERRAASLPWLPGEH